MKMIGTVWSWIWPHVSGATPINQGLDSEMFDRSDYPYTETFVREAIQNSLDARLNPTKPVVVRFKFHCQTLDAQARFLSAVIDYRKEAGFPDLPEWAESKIRWLTVEDFNSRGLGGDFEDRSSDFCNYWLNFGLSNKDGTQRGGRGIGRVTFLIASKIQTVLGYTRRHSDGITASCGMTVLRAQRDGKKFRSTHAYLAAGEKESVLELHAAEMNEDLRNTFRLTGYDAEYDSGFALVVPFPHDDLDSDRIMAAAIEHFAPAIMAGTLVIEVDESRLDGYSIPAVAARVVEKISTESVRQDVAGYLALIRIGQSGEQTRIRASGSVLGLDVSNSDETAKQLQAKLHSAETVAIRVLMPLERNGIQKEVSLVAVSRRTPRGNTAIDRLFREGMCLPDVRAKNPGELDLLLLVEDVELATYLNFCEGKAHLDLLKSKETKAKLESKGYTGVALRVRDFVKALPHKLRQLLTPDAAEADPTVFETFFSIPSEDPGKGGGNKREKPPVPPKPEPPPRKPSPLLVEPLASGLRLRANPEFSGWPVNAQVTLAYADGTRKPDWSVYDFTLDALRIEHEGCDVSYDENRLRLIGCGAETALQVTGFDSRRELDTRIRTWSDAQEN